MNVLLMPGASYNSYTHLNIFFPFCVVLQPTLISPSFYTHPQGYKMRLRMFPNGDGAAKNNAVSVFMQLQKGDCDDLLLWPFSAKVSN